MFGRSKTVYFNRYGSRRSRVRIPPWLVLLLLGLAAGVAGVLFVQERYLPPRLSADETTKLRNAYEEAAAARTQLKTDLANGQSLSQVAAAQKVSEADFRTKLVANLKPVLDKAVADKKLTSPQEQMLISRLQTGQLPLWNTPIKRRPAPTTTPSPTTT